VLDSLKIDEWLPHGERDGLGGEYHGVVRTHLSTGEAKVLGVEGCDASRSRTWRAMKSGPSAVIGCPFL
jgi:hypothetical protein